LLSSGWHDVSDLLRHHRDDQGPAVAALDPPIGPGIQKTLLTSSSSTDATAERRWSVVASNLDHFARGEPLENIVLRA
jgi:hypothetical protein